MFESIIRFSVRNKLVVALLTVAIMILGVRSMFQIPLDAVPDITNNQVQVVTTSPTLAAQEVEQFITYPIEQILANIPHVTEIRSISRFGLSVVTIVFEDHLPMLDARQYVREQLATLGEVIPPYLGEPEMMPITTGLGEIYQYTLNVEPGYEEQYDDMDLRTIQDWIVKRQLMGTKGIVDISSFGGRLKQYEVAVRPILMNQFGITMSDVFDALERNNQNSGGSYIERDGRSYYIRTEGLVRSLDDIRNILIETREGVPIKIDQVAVVRYGNGVRFGAMTMDGKGEVVGGITLMLKGGNSSEAISNVHDRIEQIKGSLPEGVVLEPFLDRSVLVGKAINTVTKNLLEGGLIVLVVLILILGNLRAGLIVASVIPLSMLFAFIMMDLFGVSANLMSLGAIDFGIVVDGAVIITEALIHAILLKQIANEKIDDFDGFVIKRSADIYKTAAFGILIILVVFIPIMSLTGIEGKMFRPMAQTFSFAILGAFILTLTYVPMVSAVVLKGKKVGEGNLAERIMQFLQRTYQPTLDFVLRHPKATTASSVALLIVALISFLLMGAVFTPTLDEGDLAMQMAVAPGSSLSRSIETSTKAEQILVSKFPEVRHVVSKIGTAEVPTDPMGIEDADIMIILKDKDEWTTTQDREELIEMMKKELEVIDWASFEFTQPIQLRFNELITGAKTDIAIKIFGEDMDELQSLADDAEVAISEVQGAADVKVEQTDGLSQYLISIDRAKCARYGISVDQVNQVVRAAYAGEKTGVVYDGERRFDLVVRFGRTQREEFELSRVYVHGIEGEHVPVSEVVQLKEVTGPVQIQREDAKRRITIGVNVRDRDVESLVEEIQSRLDAQLDLPPGYYITYGGAFENLQSAKKRLMVAVPAALGLILLLLYVAFGNMRESLLIFSAVPLSAVGGVIFLQLRGMPFSISAGVGFIALFGVAVLNGIVLIGYFRKLMDDHPDWSIRRVIENGSLVRLRPVIMTALVAMLGFMPMAFSTSEGAEVQKPLATVVIGGLVTSTLLTLVVLPAIYLLANRKKIRMPKEATILVVGIFLSVAAMAQNYTKDDAVRDALANNPDYTGAEYRLQQAEAALKGAVDLGATELGVQYGQINAPGKQDYYFEVKQQVGNPFEIAGERNYQQEVIQRNQLQVELAKRMISRDASVAWHEWQIESRKLNRLDTFKSAVSTMIEKADKRREVGDVGELEYNVLVGISMELDVQYHQQIALKLQAENALVRLASKQLNGVASGAYPLQEMESIEEVRVAPLFGSLAEQESEVALSGVKRASKAYYPSLSLGYFNQQIEGARGLDGVMAGVSIPLWNAPQKSVVQQQKIEVEIIEDRTQQWLITSEQGLKVEYARWQALDSALAGYRDRTLDGARTVFQQSFHAYELGELNYLEFLQLAKAGIQIEMNYWNLRLEHAKAFEHITYYLP